MNRTARLWKAVALPHWPGRDPEMGLSAMLNSVSEGKAAGLPHSGGRDPVKAEGPSRRYCSEGRDILLPQAAGRVPFRRSAERLKLARAGKAPSAPHAAGKVPVNVSKVCATISQNITRIAACQALHYLTERCCHVPAHEQHARMVCSWPGFA